MIRGLAEPFGIPPERFDPYRLLWRGDHVYALREEAASACHAFQWVSAGLPLAKVSGSGAARFASRGVQVFGRWATRRVCDLDEGVLSAILQGQSLPWTAEEGPVILRWLGSPLGMGLVRSGQLVGQLPRAVTEHLRPPGSGAAP